MANSYLQFSEYLTGLTRKEAVWIDELCICIAALAERDYSTAGHHFDEGGNPETDIGRKARVIMESFDDSIQWEMKKPESADDTYSLWFYAEESANPELVGEVVHQFFKEFCKTAEEPNVFTLTWATFCDKLRTGEFGGGGMVVTIEGVKTWGSHDWVEEQLTPKKGKKAK